MVFNIILIYSLILIGSDILLAPSQQHFHLLSKTVNAHETLQIKATFCFPSRS